ncbi:FadR/GntR family transcriptional regulator [Rhizobium halophytocola]|uniref:DNA-binding FadR family transcriptional regulator n=1 Tax=Rhizobium halophytocola TaxID=735519 RepID=A0ABS4DWK3_9HYPH|nr:FadR/GntR family transcriptional regulator [Rhizobium halophytocola]MBP1850076.1 DNA-binding FadR family transcriptional regulator [Rhizobium halophytocola]
MTGFEPTGGLSRNSHGQVVRELGRAIVSGELSVGSLLPNDAELASRFRVSRTVLREAMKTLSAKGLVVPKARIGTRVTERASWNMFDGDILAWHFDVGVDEDFLMHLYDIRLAFEPAAAALAATRASVEEIEALGQLADALGDADHSIESLAFADLRFHLALATASRNPFMRTLGGLIKAALVGAFRMSSLLPAGGRGDEVRASHMEIVDALRARDPAAARLAMEQVILTGQERARITYAQEHGL